MSRLAIASGIAEVQNAFVESLSRGERLRLRRERAGLTQPQMAVAASIGVETVVNIEKDRNVQTVKLEAYERALSAHERASLPLVTPASESLPIAMTDPDRPLGTDGVTIPKGDADDSDTPRPRELEARLDAQDRKIQALQNVLDSLVRSAAEQRKPRKAASDTPRRSKRDSGND